MARLNGSCQAALDSGLQQQAVDHDLDGVILAPVEFDLLIQLAQLLVHAHAQKAFRRELLEELAELTLAPAHDRAPGSSPARLRHYRRRLPGAEP